MSAPKSAAERKEQNRHNLTSQKLTIEAVGKIESIRSIAKEFSDAIVDHTPYSREQSLAITALEEATMWAVAAIARNQ